MFNVTNSGEFVAGGTIHKKKKISQTLAATLNFTQAI